MNYKKYPRFQRRLRQIGLFLVAALLLPLLVALVATPSWSADMTEQKSVTIGAQEVINDDLYLAADSITIDGTVKGDAVLAASQITINGTVEGDLVAAGRIITINGTVDDDVWMAGQVLTLGESARINDDVIAAGYSLENKPGSAIAGNLRYVGKQGLVAGTVQQNIRGAAIAMQIGGPVKGNVTVTVGNEELSHPPLLPDAPVIPSVPAGLTLTDSAQIGGALTYRSTVEANIASGATVSGRIMRTTMPAPTEQPVPQAYGIFWQLQRFVALGLVGWLLLRFVPGWTQTLSATVQARPFPSFGWGIVTVAAVAVAAIALSILMVVLLVISGLVLPILALPVLGIGLLALLALLVSFGVVSGFVPPVVLSFLVGKWLMTRFRPDRPMDNLVALLVGLVVFVLLSAIPGIGGLVTIIVFFLGLGALWLWGRQENLGITVPAQYPVKI